MGEPALRGEIGGLRASEDLVDVNGDTARDPGPVGRGRRF